MYVFVLSCVRLGVVVCTVCVSVRLCVCVSIVAERDESKECKKGRKTTVLVPGEGGTIFVAFLWLL